jgi:pimeloyl-ACP methyl ester carboxylesterase
MTLATSGQGAPTVVLVHGAFADAASWAPTTERLILAGVSVVAIVNPLRGLRHDAAYVASVINQIPGPVLAVGHSYGGAVITNACVHTPNVVGLVYVGGSKDSVLTSAVVETHYPTHDGTAPELVIDPTRFRAVFTADLPQLQSDVLGMSQRPIASGSFAEVSGEPAWKNLPVWAAVGMSDTAAGTDIVLSMARRAGADITEIDGSHVIMISQPGAVTDVILTARKAVS